MNRTSPRIVRSRRQFRLARSRKLLFEQCEGRNLLAGVWDGGAPGVLEDWNDPLNWDDNQLPGAATDVTIGAAFAGITITSAADVTVSSVTSEAGLSITGGTFSLANNSTFNGALSVGAAGTVFLDSLTVGGSGTITNQGTLNLADSVVNNALSNQGTLLVSAGTGNALNGTLTTAVGSTLRVSGPVGLQSSLTVAGGFTNQGLIEITGGATSSAVLAVATGTLTNAAAGIIRVPAAGTGFRTLTAQLNNQGTLEISRNTSINAASADHVNSGTINVLGGTLTISQSGTTPTLSNSGAINATGGGVTISGAGQAVTNSGTFNVSSGRLLNIAGGSFTNFSGGTLTGGVYNISGTLRFDGAAITTTAATVVLDGAAAEIENQTFVNALVNLAANTGNLTVQNGQNLSVSGAFSNSGNLTVGAGGTFATSGGADYTQTAGSTVLVAATSTLDPAGVVDIQGGSLSGNGTVAGNLQSQSQVSPGVSAAGLLTVGGAYSQAAAGSLQIELGGTTAGSQFDQLSASGAVSLAGNLSASLVGGFVPNVGDTFVIVNNTGAGPTTGTFAGLAEGATFSLGGSLFQITYVGGLGGNDVALTRVSSAVNAAPTLDPIANPAAILEDAGVQTVNLTGISAGAGETQTLTVTASSDNPGLIPNPTVTYTSPNSTGSLSYTPVGDQSGSAVITVTVMDDGGTAGGGVNVTTRTFTVVVTAVNDAPTLDPIADPAAIPQDAGLQTVNLAGISAGGGESQTLVVTASSSNPGLIPNPTVTYVSPNATGSLSYTPVAGQSGSAVVTVTVTDNGGTANGGVNVTTRTFTVNVTPPGANLEPTLDPIPNPAAILEDAALQTVNLTGISAGGGESQTLIVTATSNNPGLIPNPTVTYTSPNATGSLSYTPVGNQSGTAVITVTVQDTGGTANGGDDTITRTFTVNVTAVNDAPTLNPIPNPAAIPENSGSQTVNLSGITAGGGESQTLTVTATSNNPGLIPNPTVAYTSPNSTGSLSYTPVANQSGSAIITVTVTDNGGTANGGVNVTTRTFTVVVTEVGANLAPTLNAIPDPAAILEDASTQTVNLSGITAGAGESQTLTVTATSSNPGLIPNPTVAYTSPNTTGSLSYTPVGNQSGSAVITVTVRDSGGTANGGVDTTTRTFTVNVTAVNDAPTLSAIPNPPAIPEDAGLQTVNLAGISAGGGESQTLTVTATSSNPGLIPNPTVVYTSANATGSLSFTPVAGQSGTAVITVRVTDDGGTANGGVNTTTRTFSVTVLPETPPDFDISDPSSASIVDDPANPGEFALLVVGTSKNDVVIVEPRSGGNVRVKLNGKTLGTFDRDDFERIAVFGLAGNDKLIVNSSLGINAELHGGSGNDHLYGGSSGDLLFGEEGNDKLHGGKGNDRLFGGDGNDQLYGAGGNDLLFGEAGNDKLHGESGSDVLVGGEGNDSLYGGSGRDVLIGGVGGDRVQGDSDEDILIGGFTDHDEDLAALRAIQAEWNSSRSQETRVQNLTDGSGSSERLNDEFFLELGTTVFDDTSRDDFPGLNQGRRRDLRLA